MDKGRRVTSAGWRQKWHPAVKNWLIFEEYIPLISTFNCAWFIVVRDIARDACSRTVAVFVIQLASRRI